jgi:transcriptional regulator
VYVPLHFEEKRPAVLHQLMHDHALAVLVTLSSDGLSANHIPLEHNPEPAPFGTIRGHVARANPVWRDFSADVGALAIFQGPQGYITPSWYPTTFESGEVVPTYNYLVVHAYGPVRVIDDRAWLRQLVGRLTTRYEAERPAPWQVSDAPADFIERQLHAIVGIEIPVHKLMGKWKVSQNRGLADREGVVKGLRESNDAEALVMAEWVENTLDS